MHVSGYKGMHVRGYKGMYVRGIGGACKWVYMQGRDQGVKIIVCINQYTASFT